MRRLDTKTPWFKFLSWSLSIIILIIALMISIPYLLAGAAVYFFYANEKSIEKHEVILDKRYAPILNPHPKYFFTIKGHIDKELMKTMHLRFYAYYEKTNNLAEKKYQIIARFGNESVKTINYSGSDTYQCSRDADCKITKYKIFTTDGFRGLSYDKNYSYQIQFLLESQRWQPKTSKKMLI